MKSMTTDFTRALRSLRTAVMAGLLLMSSFPGSAGVAFAQDLFVANYNAGTVLRVTPGGVVSTVASGFNSPTGLVFNAGGDLFVANQGNGNVHKVTPGGVVSLVATGFSGPSGLAIDASGNLFVPGLFSGTIHKVTPGGVSSLFASGLGNIAGLAFGPGGDLFVGGWTSGIVYRVTPAGVVSTFASMPGLLLHTPAFDAGGNLYVAAYNSGEIFRVTPAGVVSSFATGFQQPIGLTVGPGGVLFVANRGTGEVLQVTPGGVISPVLSIWPNVPYGLAGGFPGGGGGSSPESCTAILLDGGSVGDGVYTIDPAQNGNDISVYCDMTTDGGGWTLVGYGANANLSGNLTAPNGTYDPTNRVGSANIEGVTLALWAEVKSRSPVAKSGARPKI